MSFGSLVVLALVWVTVMVALILSKEFGIKILVLKIAKHDTWWSPLRLLPPPGEMVIVVKGSEDGPYDRVVTSIPGHWFNPETGYIEETGSAEVVLGPWGEYFQSIGVVWVGFFKKLMHREIAYSKYTQVPNSTDWQLVKKVRTGANIFYRYNMAVEVKEAETVGNFPINALIVLTAQISAPVRALFFSGGWEKQLVASVQTCFRKYVSDKDIATLREAHRTDTTSVSTLIKDLTERGPDGLAGSGLLNLFGVEIKDARFVLFDLTSGDEEMNRATKALEIARQQALADIERGRGEGGKMTEVAKGIKAQIDAWTSSPDGKHIAMAEALKVAKPSVIGAGVIVSIDDKNDKKRGKEDA